MTKPMVYKEEDGTQYKISYSEKLQLKNLGESKRIRGWLQINFYSNILLLIQKQIKMKYCLFWTRRLISLNILYIQI